MTTLSKTLLSLVFIFLIITAGILIGVVLGKLFPYPINVIVAFTSSYIFVFGTTMAVLKSIWL